MRLGALLVGLVVSAVGLLAGCGLQPVYSAQGMGVGQVTVATISGRAGYLVRIALERLSVLEQAGLETPVLTVELSTRFRDASTRIDSFSDRTLVEVTAQWTLATADGNLAGTVRVDTGYDSRDEAYGGVALQADAEERVAGAVARAIWSDIRAKRGQR